MFIYQVIGLGIISFFILFWLFKKLFSAKPLFIDVMILTLFLLGTISLIEDIIKNRDLFVSVMCIINSFILAFGRYRQVKKDRKEQS